MDRREVLLPLWEDVSRVDPGKEEDGQRLTEGARERCQGIRYRRYSRVRVAEELIVML